MHRTSTTPPGRKPQGQQQPEQKKQGQRPEQDRNDADGEAAAALNAVPGQRTRARHAPEDPQVRLPEGSSVRLPEGSPVRLPEAPQMPAPEAPRKHLPQDPQTHAPESSPEPAAADPRARVQPPVPDRRWHLWHLLPTPTGTPFTFGYALVLVATSLYAQLGDPATVGALLRASSTDVAHLTHTPVVALVGSALWVAGGLASPYALGFLVILTALERRIGGLRTAAVFAFGHVVASLATEIPVGVAVWAGHLPETSLHRLDFGISFGLLACVGALAGVLRLAWLRWGLLGAVALVLLQDLIAYVDPLTALGHPLALCLGLAGWPVVRRWKAARAAPSYL
ncbi:rhomboid-like protein [Streptomyces sp. NPDC088745]|uniref:rhomboid-like protein n=1 Tax=Streptomyces sp. NPDC088745 TaxID=3365884 RepID=UPI0037F2AC18